MIPKCFYSISVLQNFLLLVPLSIYTSNLNAQRLPNLETQSTRPTFYEESQTSTYLETTNTYHLKGKVKEILEVISAGNMNYDSCSFTQARYLFSEKGNLISYQADTNRNALTTYDEIREIRNSYDSSGTFLLESIVYQGYHRDPSVTTIRFNQQGFVEHITYSCNNHLNNYDSPEEAGIFDYTADYSWNTNFDTLSVDYEYSNPLRLYQRKEDRSYSFNHNIASIHNLMGGTNSGSYDEKGRLISWTIIDRTPQNSFHVDQFYKYAYNDRNELIEINYSTEIEGSSRPSSWGGYHIKINYVSYDKYGNWTEKEITGMGMILTTNDSAVPTYTYKRYLTYY